MLGPIVYVIFINDMPNSVLSTCNMFANDGVVVSMFDFHRSDRGSNPGRGGKIS